MERFKEIGKEMSQKFTRELIEKSEILREESTEDMVIHTAQTVVVVAAVIMVDTIDVTEENMVIIN